MGPTKTDERRIVRLPRFLVELLAEHLAGRVCLGRSAPTIFGTRP
jgi:hypothetical protein